MQQGPTQAEDGEWDGAMRWGSDDAAVSTGGCAWWSVALVLITRPLVPLTSVWRCRDARQTQARRLCHHSFSPLLALSNDNSHFSTVTDYNASTGFSEGNKTHFTLAHTFLLSRLRQKSQQSQSRLDYTTVLWTKSCKKLRHYQGDPLHLPLPPRPTAPPHTPVSNSIQTPALCTRAARVHLCTWLKCYLLHVGW